MDRTERGKHSQLIKHFVAVYSRKTNLTAPILIGSQPEKLEIAKQMLSKGLDMQFICEMTGLSEAKINALK